MRRESILNKIKLKKSFKQKILFIIALLFISNSAFANTQPTLNYVEAIKTTDFYSNRQKDIFTSTLANEYKSYALYKAHFTPDVRGANYFAAKALNAYYGEKVKPDNIYKRRLPQKNIILISNYYDDLNQLLKTELVNTHPQLMAEAQSKFDCWVDSEENGLNPMQAKKCLARFQKARNYLFSKLNPECVACKEKTEEKQVAKIEEFDGKILPIPVWPNIPLIANNPPIPVLKHTIVHNNSYNTKTEKVTTEKASTEPKTIIAQPDNAATTEDIANLEAVIWELEERLFELQNQKSETVIQRDNTTTVHTYENIDDLRDQLADLHNKIDELMRKENEYVYINQNDYIETEVYSAPSEFLPFEIFFDWDKADVDYKFRPQLKDISEKALASKEMIIIQGHADSSGNEKYNKTLSNNRADNVAKLLVSYGIPKSKITIQAMGSSDPKIPTKKGVKKAENRRVVIK